MKVCTIEEILIENGIKYTKEEEEGRKFTKILIEHDCGKIVLTDELSIEKGKDDDKIMYGCWCDLSLLHLDMLDFDTIYSLIKHHEACSKKLRG